MSFANKTHVAVVAVVGTFQNGKSTLVNCLIDNNYAPTGKGLATTHWCTRFCFGDAEEAWHIHRSGEEELLDRREELFNSARKTSVGDWFRIKAWKPILKSVEIIDTPGFDANKADDQAALSAIAAAELIVVVQAEKSMNTQCRDILQEIFAQGKRGMFLYNCNNIARWSPKENNDVCKEIEADLLNFGLADSFLKVNGHLVFPINALWAWFALGHLQRDLDVSDKDTFNAAKQDIKRIKRYFKDELDMPNPSKRDILILSGVLTVRQTLEEYIAMSLDGVFNDSSREVRAITSRWLDKIRTIIDG